MRPSDYKKRLLALADFLDNLPRHRFYYATWFTNRTGGECGNQLQALKHSCGTTACALGWATTMPQFKRLGLVWEGARITLKKYITEGTCSGYYETIHSACEIFGLSFGEAEYLFIPDMSFRDAKAPRANASPQTVATHLRSFANNKWPCASKK